MIRFVAVLSLTMIIRVAILRTVRSVPSARLPRTPEPVTLSSAFSTRRSSQRALPSATSDSSVHRIGSLIVLAVFTRESPFSVKFSVFRFFA